MKKQKGGNEDLETSLATPISNLWLYIVNRKKTIFDKKFTDLSKQIEEVMYRECTSGPNCKKTRSKNNHPIFQAIINLLKTLGTPDDKSIFDNEDIIEMMVRFLQAVYLPVARITMNMNDFTDDFMSAVNMLIGTEYPYLVQYCQARSDNVSFNGKMSENDLYTCGRAVSAIPYSCMISRVPRIVIHRTMGRANDDQDNSDPLMVANEKCNDVSVSFVGGRRKTRSTKSKSVTI